MKKRIKELDKKATKGKSKDTDDKKRKRKRKPEDNNKSNLNAKEDNIEVNNINRRQIRRLKLKKTRKVTLSLIARKIYLRFYHTKNYLFLPAVMTLGNYMSHVCMYCRKKYF